jgi:hypothetical protein
MTMSDMELMNEETGEVLTLTDYLAQQQEIEREILRLDSAIEMHRESLKAAKDGQKKAYRDLRATVREIKILGGDAKSPARARRKLKARKTR